ncbi:serine hydrolase [Phenylobacterium sp.]|uniref:serine hydrolase n=1 Tax=Phenylobacterium sp. TaxID=1871053 RepID=UPI0025F1FD92|nr:serine hydrolase [Phenylobacterium sp.]
MSAHDALAAGAACPNPAFVREAQSAIAAYDQAGMFSGAVLVAANGRPVLRRGVGLADRELGVAAAPEMKFRIGSITKQFTATAILQLQEAGKLSIDDPISKYYADAPAAWSKVTLRHLLTHSSGIPTYTALPGFFDRTARLPHTPEELIKLTRDKPLEFEPGSKFAYDNSGYILLGYVVEKVSGQPYADYLKQHIFGPLHMTGSGYDREDTIILGRVPGYQRAPDGGLGNAPFLDMSVPFAAGSLYSTVDDLLAWDQALYAASPLKPNSLKAMFTDYGHHYGFGFVIDQQWGQDRIWHNGGVNGFTASFQRYPKSRITAVALANQTTPATDKLATDLAGLCLGAKVYPRQAPETATALARYAGFYELSPFIVTKVDIRAPGLISHIAGQPDLRLYPAGGGKFFAKTADVELTFQTGADGQVSGVVIQQGGQQPLAKRIDAAEAERLAKAKAAHLAAGVASPGTEEALRRVIGGLQSGAPDYSRMAPSLAEATRRQADGIRTALAQLGPLKSVTFQSVGPGGADIYIVAFEKGSLEWRIVLGDGGQIVGLVFRQSPG